MMVTAHRCRRDHCGAPLVELLSDAAGRVYGCPRCQCVAPENCEPPADVVGQRRLGRRERRVRARKWTRGRRGARAVAGMMWERRERPDRYVVLRREAMEQHGTTVRDLGDGWVLGLLMQETPTNVLVTRTAPRVWAIDTAHIPEAVEVRTEIVRLKRISGPCTGWADEQAPEGLVVGAFERLYLERATPAARAFLAPPLGR